MRLFFHNGLVHYNILVKKRVHNKNLWCITKNTGTCNLQTCPRITKQEPLLIRLANDISIFLCTISRWTGKCVCLSLSVSFSLSPICYHCIYIFVLSTYVSLHLCFSASLSLSLSLFLSLCICLSVSVSLSLILVIRHNFQVWISPTTTTGTSS